MMSDEESDEDGEPLFWIRELKWRSQALSAFLYTLDDDSRISSTRRSRLDVENSAKVPNGFPINFYSEEWINCSQIGTFIKGTSLKPISIPLDMGI
jgi:hypothetical protein